MAGDDFTLWNQERANYKNKIAHFKVEKLKEYCNRLGVNVEQFNINCFHLSKPGYSDTNYYAKSNKIFIKSGTGDQWQSCKPMLKVLTSIYANQ